MTKLIKPKIIISSYDDLKNPFYGGGGAVAIHEVFKRLTNNYQVVVLTGTYPGSKNIVVDKILYQRIGSSLLGPRIGQLIFQLLLPYYAVVKEYNLWIESFTPPFSTACLQLFTKKPVVGLVHMLCASDMQRKYKIPFGVLEALENIGLKTYRHFIVLTESTKLKIVHINRRASFLRVSNGISLPKNYLIQNKKIGEYILFLGRIEVNQKGLDLLLKSYKSFLKEDNMQLIIAGFGVKSEEKKLVNLISDLGLNKKVKFIGRVTGTTKDRLLKYASFIVISSRFETFSLVALEALSFSLPLITFDIDGLKWIPKNSVIKVKPFDVNLLTKEMLRLATDNHLRTSLGSCGQLYVKNLSWDNLAKQYDQYITKVSIGSNYE
ncbi:MAG: glycosyltransferase family 4 protein [Candidatus Daviesbacteria bacterium]|nr:glycosyltransferase family 4 protein [Candidatus Daviesbacteria bacterium]